MNTSIHSQQVCKNYLCGVCPSYLFSQIETGWKLKECDLIHSDALKKEYAMARQTASFGYEESNIRLLDIIAEELRIKVMNSEARLSKPDPECEWSVHVEQIEKLSAAVDSIMKHFQDMDKYGISDDAFDVLRKLEQVKRCQTQAEFGMKSVDVVSIGESAGLQVCRVCGACTRIWNDENGTDPHFDDAIHRAYDEILQTRVNLKKFLSEQQ